ncbi:MAG: cysteine--tRNA ligase [Candidatus Parvarchaeota archaeon]|nr:cysteine--tRNA ligase [Candidatus Jingweiarchaeum tengchongense]MCW1297689.1 cysteine--tRNA ligase [Candidatus Jingweiarchaeum tengchongense]MCW1299700.1 cysteine--tRNA ligase [Candidatus Jingweiarchaeum tengchongense]MCW1304332.1 cysteine--tRNA ligase [Candidatus Jingweiarchaeum tengchongense]MCW1305685.1 cysteine--tRNA ligase [Candidatus Jingweiarchaeum tengchongense]
MIKLFDTFTRKKRKFVPIEKGKVRMYCCGLTVYNYAHIGNLRTYIFEDVLRRMFEYNGFQVIHVMNVTDVGHLTSDADTGEDKVEMGAKREGKTAWEIAEFYTKAFLLDMERLNILKPTILCKATDHIKEMIELIKKLEEKGYTYLTDDGLYYDTSKFKEYGKLTGMTFKELNEKLKAGARVEFNPQKRNITDFALWKFSPKDKKRQMEWDSPWGVGFPGWHIECTAMSMKYLGEHFDIHCGGIDHIPIHHTNEIAQAEAATGKKFVNYWLHGAFLVLGPGIKMAKSAGNFITLQTLIDNGYDPLAYRYLCLTAHYRSELKFEFENMKAAMNSLSTLRENVRIMKGNLESKVNKRKIAKYKKEFLNAINDDLNMPLALSILWKVVRSKELNNQEKYELVLDFDRVLGLNLDVEVKVELTEEQKRLIEEREKARKEKDWKTADEIREKLRKQGIILEDTDKGVVWKKIHSSS